MALEIKEDKGIFEVIGELTSQNLGALKVYFESALEVTDEMVISLEKVTVMDSSVALFFEKLYKQVAANHKVLAIVGRQNKEISEVMNITKTDYILSSDRV
ncbi:hypothetical protein MTsPCn5_16070 [Croceitalea sp. MTPC5]|uniref:STAS domain-containing protein n=1 Tax=Croceitalea sp. MTPC5 TaxID=3056565 RepID=UPI002B3FE524|nr:hypothetical protein MTsPCn5_16070 [Croceitalea sp. MTPC5]